MGSFTYGNFAKASAQRNRSKQAFAWYAVVLDFIGVDVFDLRAFDDHVLATAVAFSHRLGNVFSRAGSWARRSFFPAAWILRHYLFQPTAPADFEKIFVGFISIPASVDFDAAVS